MSTQQLALSLFESLAPVGKDVTKANADIGFRRNDIFVEIVDLSLVARRAIDVAYFIVAQTPTIEKNYVVDLGFFRWLMCTSSKNRHHLRSILREGQKAAIQVNDIDLENPDNDRWVSVPLLGPVGISNGKLFFEVHEKLQAEIANPASSHFLSLRFVFKSLHAKIIYDRIQPFLASGATPWYELATMRKWLNITGKSYEEFKNLKRNVIEVALKQINELSNLTVTFDTQNVPGSKKIDKIRFRVVVRAGIEATNTAMMVLKSLYETLQGEFGLSREQLNEIMANRDEWTDERLQQAMDYTRFNIEQGKVKKSASGYLMKALKEHYVVGTADLRIARQTKGSENAQKSLWLPAPTEDKPTPPAEPSAAEKARTAEQEAKILAAFAKLPVAEQARISATFSATEVARLIASRTKLPRSRLSEHLETNEWIRSSFCAHLRSTGTPKKPGPVATPAAPRKTTTVAMPAAPVRKAAGGKRA